MSDTEIPTSVILASLKKFEEYQRAEALVESKANELLTEYVADTGQKVRNYIKDGNTVIDLKEELRASLLTTLQKFEKLSVLWKEALAEVGASRAVREIVSNIQKEIPSDEYKQFTESLEDPIGTEDPVLASIVRRWRRPPINSLTETEFKEAQAAVNRYGYLRSVGQLEKSPITLREYKVLSQVVSAYKYARAHDTES